MVQVQFGGGEQLEALAKRLAAAANSDLVVREVGQALRTAVPEVEAVLVKGTERLPKRGGLADQVAKTKVAVKVTSRRGFYSVRLTALLNAVRDPGAIDRGRVAHQAWGRWTKPLLIQLVPKGWFSESMKDLAPTLRARAAAALRAALRKV